MKTEAMVMAPRFRKFVLTAHVTSSVGWLGAVAGFLSLAIAGLTSHDAQMVRAAYLSMELTGWYVIVPFCIASLVTGLAVSLGTPWGLFRHYWILVKLLLTIISALILFGFTRTLSFLGCLAANTTLSIDELRNLNQSPVLHSGGGLLVLLVTTILAVYKPWGKTRYGVPKQHEQNERVPVRESSTRKPWRLYVMLGLICLVLLFIVLHLIGGGGPSGH